jgi:hypothetical protein
MPLRIGGLLHFQNVPSIIRRYAGDCGFRTLIQLLHGATPETAALWERGLYQGLITQPGPSQSHGEQGRAPKQSKKQHPSKAKQ